LGTGVVAVQEEEKKFYFVFLRNKNAFHLVDHDLG
jgi:hypothetical protein